MARAFGPKSLGYFNYVLWVTNMTGAVGALGLPVTTRKYMAEYLAVGEKGIARSIFFSTFRLQLLLSSALAACGAAVAWRWADPGYSLISIFIVMALIPRMLTLIPSQANVAFEKLKANAPGGLAGTFVYVAAITLSLRFGWGLLGIAIGIFVSSCLELGIKLWYTLRWVSPLPSGVPIPGEVRRRMLRFSGQSVVLMLIDLVVWNRSDIFFLRLLDKDIRQITFFSLAFNITEKIVLIPDTLGSAMGASIMAQYDRDRAKLPNMVSTAASYMFMVALPLLLGVGVLSRPLSEALYGSRYLPVAPVLTIAAILAIPKALRHPVQELLQAAEDQKFVISWFAACGVANCLLDVLLIPGRGATGAAAANGIAQMLAVLGLWFRAFGMFRLSVRKAPFARMLLAGVAMVAVLAIELALPGRWVVLVISTLSGAVVYALMLRFTAALSLEDRERFLRARHAVPARLRVYFDSAIDLVAPVRSGMLHDGTYQQASLS